jgi:hypothetical protein
MALEGANLISSTYNGNDNNSLNTYNKLYQQQALKRAAEQKSLTEELSKLDTNGLRAQDMDNYVNKHNDWKNAAIAADKERDPTKKAKLLIDADRYHIAEKQYLQASKDEKAGSTDYGRRMLDPNFRDRVSQAGFDQYQKNNKLSISDEGFNNDYASFGFKPDFSKVQSIFDNTNKNLQAGKQQMSQTPITNRMSLEGVPTTFYSFEMGVDPKKQYEAYSKDFDINQNIRQFAQQQLPQLDWANNPQQAKDQYIKELIKSNDLTTYTKPERFSKPEKGVGGEDAKSSTYRQQLIQGIFNGKTSDIDKLKAYLPQKSSVEYLESKATSKSKGGYKFIRVNIPDIVQQNGTIIQGVKDLDISFAKGDAANQFNNILSKYTGEVVKMSKFNIKGGKPTGPQVNIKGDTSQSKDKLKSNKNNTFTSKSGIKFKVE